MPHSRSFVVRPWLIFFGVLIIVGVVGVSAWVWSKPATAQEALRRGHYDLAMRYLMAASDKGDPAAQNAIGNLYVLGLGVERDRTIAATWYRRAAFAGNAQARVNMGHLYNHAFTLDNAPNSTGNYDPNAILSYAWFNLARNQGHSQAQLYMSELLKERLMKHHLVNQVRRDYATIENFRDTDAPNLIP